MQCNAVVMSVLLSVCNRNAWTKSLSVVQWQPAAAVQPLATPPMPQAVIRSGGHVYANLSGNRHLVLSSLYNKLFICQSVGLGVVKKPDGGISWKVTKEWFFRTFSLHRMIGMQPIATDVCGVCHKCTAVTPNVAVLFMSQSLCVWPHEISTTGSTGRKWCHLIGICPAANAGSGWKLVTFDLEISFSKLELADNFWIAWLDNSVMGVRI